MARKPVVGITAAIESAAWTLWKDTLANLSQRTYSLCVADAGATPVILPPDEASEGAPDDVLDILDALILSGGADLDPASYGAEPHEATTGFKAERDRFELALARRALGRDTPVLGICRGMQLLNVACGGTLIQDLANRQVHVEVPGTFSHHGVRLEPGSLAARSLGGELVDVHSHHHQGVDRLGDGLEVTGWAEPDDLVEAIEMPGRRFALGVMWHPEEHRNAPAVRALADAARQGVAA
ncbi:MAG: gamma-glutamyl-gamma-aminobutyrate hydrolase family protein [Actinomycetota bacterium]|nr:gamma-glutamyl-gamma-aminobutyrate hydrolase family protein [Actinomycetota bacterium]